MAELRKIKVGSLEPNPFRDGQGGNPAATWLTVSESYGYDEGKINELIESYKINGVWPGMIVRENGKGFQLAFGHHRAEAARRLELDVITVIVEELSDDQMLQRMASENSEEYGHDFALGVMNAVEAVVRAYQAGQIELPKPTKMRFFSSLNTDERPFSPLTVAQFLGWTHPDPTNGTAAVRAAEKVNTAIAALDLINLGVLKRAQLKGLGSYQAKDLVKLTRRKMEQEKEAFEREKQALEEARKSALASDDKRKAEGIAKRIEEVDAASVKAVKHAGQAAVSAVQEFYSPEKGMAEALKEAAEKLRLKGEPIVKPRKAKEIDYGTVDDFTGKVDSTLLEEDSRWLKILEMAKISAAKKSFRELAESLEQLAERAGARSKELRKVING